MENNKHTLNQLINKQKTRPLKTNKYTYIYLFNCIYLNVYIFVLRKLYFYILYMGICIKVNKLLTLSDINISVCSNVYR